MIIQFNDYKDKVLGCLYGKNIGGTLGAPFECYRGVHDVNFYTQDTSKPIPNDDVDLQLVWLRAVEMEGKKLDAQVLAEYWSTYISASLAEYGTGKNNFRMGIRPPLSGHLRNRNRDSNGAWIRTEIWACLAAGHPDVAARFALEDAMVDHSGEGVYSAVFLAAMQSAAFVESDTMKLIEIGLSYIPEDCGITKGVRTVIECYGKGMDWKQARKVLFRTVPGSFGMMGGYFEGQTPEEDVPVGENGYDAPSNVGIIILGLLYGEGDFARSICLATDCGEDTDCTAGTLAALLGIVLGKKKLPEKWVKGCSDEISTWCLRIDAALRLPKTVTEFAERIIRQTPVMLNEYCDVTAKGGFTIESAAKLHRNGDVVAPYWNTFEKLLCDVPRATRDRFTLYDVVVEYDENFVSLEEGKEKTLSLRFINKLFDPQYLTVRFLDFPAEFVMEGGTEHCVGIEHLHGSFNESRLEIRFTPQSLLRGRYDLVMEIRSEGRMTRNFIPMTFINGNCLEIAK